MGEVYGEPPTKMPISTRHQNFRTSILHLMSTAGDGYVHDEAFDAAVEAACSSTVVSMLCAASIDILHHVLEDDERNSPRIRFEEKHGRAKYLYEWEKSQIYVDAFDPKARNEHHEHHGQGAVLNLPDAEHEAESEPLNCVPTSEKRPSQESFHL